MTKLIAAVIIIAVLYGGWHLFLYWEHVKNTEDMEQKQQVEDMAIGDRLPGLPDKLVPAWQNAQKHGAAGLGNFLRLNGQSLSDPRKAWIELDYCVAVAREDPAEAKRVFTAVKDRTPNSSEVYPRIQRLEKTFQ